MTVALGCLLVFSVLAFASTVPWALASLQIGIFALGLVCAARRNLLWHPLGFAFAGAAACGGWQLLTGSTVYRFATEQAALSSAAYFVLFVVVLQALADSAIRGRFLRAVLFGGFGIAVLSTVQYFTSGGLIYWIVRPRAGRPFGPFVNPDHYAAFVELILPLAIYQARRDRERMGLYLVIAGVLYGSAIASASRAGALIATVEILVLPLLGRSWRRAGLAIGASVGIGALAIAMVGGDALWRRLQDKHPFRYRREILESTVRMIRERPWTGFGLGTYATVYPEFATFDIGLAVDHAHNDWAEWTAEGGAPLLALMLAIAVATFRPAVRSGWGLGVHAVLLHSVVDFPMRIPAIAALVVTLVAALCASREQATRLNADPKAIAR